MVQIVISDLGTIRLAQNILSGMPAKIKTVIRRAAIDTVRAVKAEIPRAVNARYDISRPEVRRQMILRTVTEDGGMRTGLIVQGKRIPAIKFSVQPRTPPPQAGDTHSQPDASQDYDGSIQMTKKTMRRQRRLTKMAAEVHLTLNQFILLVQMGGDVQEHSDDRVQPMSFEKTSWGCQLNLISINAVYRVQIWRPHRLRCVCERYGAGSGVIHDSGDMVEDWELLRKRILWVEGVQTWTAKDFDRCQKLKLEEVA